MRKSVFEKISEAYDKLLQLKPTNEEIEAYIKDLEENGSPYGVITYSISKRDGEPTFLRLHETYRRKPGGKTHIDIGFTDLKMKEQNDNAWYRNIYDTTHLMLDVDHSIEFVDFIENMRKCSIE